MFDWRKSISRIPESVWHWTLLVVSLLISLASARPGFLRLMDGLGTNSPYAYRYNYLEHAVMWFLLAFGAAYFAIHAFKSDNFGLERTALGVAIVVLLITLIFFHNRAPRDAAAFVISHHLGTVAAEIDDWTKRHGHLPFYKQETLDAIHLPSDAPPILHNGSPVHYRFIVAGQSDFGIQSPPVAAEAGEIYYTISSDESAYTLSIVTPKQNSGDELWVDPQLTIHRRISKP